jgi:hypothetical protein
VFYLRHSSNWNPHRLHSEPFPPKENHNVGLLRFDDDHDHICYRFAQVQIFGGKSNVFKSLQLIDAIKFCGAFELALREHDEGVESNNPGIFRGLINLIAEVDDILKLHIDLSKNTVFTGTDMDIDSNKKVLGTIRIDPSVPSLSIWSRAPTGNNNPEL